jgi:hypothetical protein
MLFSLKDLASKLSPTQGENMHVIKTNMFTLHHFQSVSGLMFVLNTKPDIPGKFKPTHADGFVIAWQFNVALAVSRHIWIDLYNALQNVYSNIFIDFVARNPLYNFKNDEPISCPLFAAKVDEYLLTLPTRWFESGLESSFLW